MSKLAQPGDFCPNPDCAEYGKPQTTAHQNIKFGRARNGQQRYQCRTCRHTFTATKGTLFYRRQTPTRKQAQPGWQYLQMVKQRDEHGPLAHGPVFGTNYTFDKSGTFIPLTVTQMHFIMSIRRRLAG